MALVHDNPNTLGGNPQTIGSYLTEGSGNLYVELRRTTVAPGIWWFWVRVSWRVEGAGVYLNPSLNINGTQVSGVGWISSPSNTLKPGDQWTSQAIGFDMAGPNSPREFTGWYGSGDPTYRPATVTFSVQARELEEM